MERLGSRMNIYPRETSEFMAVHVERDGVAVTDDTVSFSVVKGEGTRPGPFEPAELLDGKVGVQVYGLQPGVYRVWARVDTAAEQPVIDCGLFRVE